MLFVKRHLNSMRTENKKLKQTLFLFITLVTLRHKQFSMLVRIPGNWTSGTVDKITNIKHAYV